MHPNPHRRLAAASPSRGWLGEGRPERRSYPVGSTTSMAPRTSLRKRKASPSSARRRGIEPGNVLLVAFMSIVSGTGIGVLTGSPLAGIGTGLVVLLATILVLVAV